MDDLNGLYNDLLNSLEDYIDINYDNNANYGKYSCVNCYHSNGRYCLLKDKDINDKISVCWCYRDCFSMRTISDFQDDNNDFYEYYEHKYDKEDMY